MTPADEFNECARFGHPTDDTGLCDCGAIGPPLPPGLNRTPCTDCGQYSVLEPRCGDCAMRHHLSQACDVDGCDRVATHDAQPGGRVCNAHIPAGAWAHARND